MVGRERVRGQLGEHADVQQSGIVKVSEDAGRGWMSDPGARREASRRELQSSRVNESSKDPRMAPAAEDVIQRSCEVHLER